MMADSTRESLMAQSAKSGRSHYGPTLGDGTLFPRPPSQTVAGPAGDRINAHLEETLRGTVRGRALIRKSGGPLK